MNALVIGIVVCIVLAILIEIWFIVAFRKLKKQREMVLVAKTQCEIYQKEYVGSGKFVGSSQDAAVLECSLDLYKQALDIYNSNLNNFKYRVPGIILGFKKIK
ncbi:MAG: hypothetical protein RR495_02790 [Anaerovoracaceae bacterium]